MIMDLNEVQDARGGYPVGHLSDDAVPCVRVDLGLRLRQKVGPRHESGSGWRSLSGCRRSPVSELHRLNLKGQTGRAPGFGIPPP